MTTSDGVSPMLAVGLRRRWLLRRHASVELYWLPLGAGDAVPVVRWNGRAYEGLTAFLHHRQPLDLYHSALMVSLDGDRFVIEMAPAWERSAADRGVMSEGPVGLRCLGLFRPFRYEVRRWHDGVIKDAAAAVESPQAIDTDPIRTQLLLELLRSFPTATWGRDELATGEMWNSNSLISWLLSSSHHETDDIVPPAHGRAPGWNAGLRVATRERNAALVVPGRTHLRGEQLVPTARCPGRAI